MGAWGNGEFDSDCALEMLEEAISGFCVELEHHLRNYGGDFCYAEFQEVGAWSGMIYALVQRYGNSVYSRSDAKRWLSNAKTIFDSIEGQASVRWRGTAEELQASQNESRRSIIRYLRRLVRYGTEHETAFLSSYRQWCTKEFGKRWVNRNLPGG